MPPADEAARIAAAKDAWKAPRATKTSPRSISARSPIPSRSAGPCAAARLARIMRTRLTRRDLRVARLRLDLRRTIHGNISHGGVPFDLVKRQRKHKPLRLVVLLDASGSMSMYMALPAFHPRRSRRIPRGRCFPVSHPARSRLRRDEGKGCRPRARSAGLMAQGVGGGTRIGESLQPSIAGMPRA